MQNAHVQRKCLMYHAVCKVEFQPFNRSFSQLTFFILFVSIYSGVYIYRDIENKANNVPHIIYTR